MNKLSLVGMQLPEKYTVLEVRLAKCDVNGHSPINQNLDLNKSRQKFHHSLKEHHKISNIPKFRAKCCKMRII